MSKRTSRRGQAARRASQDTASSVGSGRSKNASPSRNFWGLPRWGLGAIGLLLLVSLGIWFVVGTESGRAALESLPIGPASIGRESVQESDVASAPEMAGDAGGVFATIRATDTCRQQPSFTQKLEFGPRTVFGTALPGYLGLIIYDPDQDALYQHPTWDDAGNLGAYVVDGQGNVFVAPTPLSSLELNPPDEQNRIYQVDTVTSEMTPFLELPTAQPPSEFNPYGVVGMGLDCSTQSLYVASIAGSTPTEEVGRIFRVDLQTGQIADQLENVDAMGVGVGVLPDGERRLYYGLARTSEVRSLRLDAAGNFNSDEFRTEFVLATLPGGRNERAQRIRFDGQGAIVVKGLEFNYSLQVTSQVPITNYWLRYVLETQTWEVIDIQHETPTPGEATVP